MRNLHDTGWMLSTQVVQKREWTNFTLLRAFFWEEQKQKFQLFYRQKFNSQL